MWQGKMKALTFSYDDGVQDDKRLVEIFNRYGMKGTFNLNSGLMSEKEGWIEPQRGLLISHLNADEVVDLYRGHEIAVHTVHHPDLTALDAATLKAELEEDKAALEAMFGTSVVGMAYPYGTYNDTVVEAVRAAGLHYGRVVGGTHHTALPASPLTWMMTCDHLDERLMEMGRAFLEATPDTPQVFSVWGHSYAFTVDDNWHVIEEFCEMMAGRNDIAYITNREVFGL